MKNVLNYVALCLELINKNIRTILELRTIVNVQYYDSFLKDCEKFLFSNPFEESNDKTTYILLNNIQYMLPNIIGFGIDEDNVNKKPKKRDCGSPDYGYYDIVMNRYYTFDENVNEDVIISDVNLEDKCKNIPIEDLGKYLYDNYKLKDINIFDNDIDLFNKYIMERCFISTQIYGIYSSKKKIYKDTNMMKLLQHIERNLY
jgi:hypothetical protein